MHLSDSFWKAVAVVTSYLTLPPFHPSDSQQPLTIPVDVHANEYDALNYPIFPAPGQPEGEKEFTCSYPEMKGWEYCNSKADRSCWLRHPNGSRYDIVTDYENYAPIGITRNYSLTIDYGDWNTDGLWSKGMILVNGQYPGPLIQACWGDQVVVNVTNKLRWNGTAIHWHGIRQLNTMHMDGVPGITQCPISPNDYFVYNFTARQYGSSWYHSHYSVQYANGLLGPMTLHGPTTERWDESKDPLLMTDWFHNSAFTVIHNGATPGYPSILLNGAGDVRKFNGTENVIYPTPDAPIPAKYNLIFEKPSIFPPGPIKRYLLRIINTSFSTTFTFSIDHHLLTIVSADFVPMLPYPVSHITVGIGQRYNVIVEANPIAYGRGLPTDGNYWIRTGVSKCFLLSVIGTEGYNKTGILRYDPNSKSDPTSEQWNDVNSTCTDMTGLVPQLPWEVGKPANGDGTEYGEEFDPVLNLNHRIPAFPLARWSLEPGPADTSGFTPMQINYSDPIFLHLNENKTNWPASWIVVPEDYDEDDWVYLAFAGPGGNAIKANHPLHLHGHDFAVVQVETDKALEPQNIKINTKNPIRRDVVFLPSNGFIIIAFKADNPGNWIMHCHIAFHASEGLAIQILERREAANERWPQPSSPAIVEANRVCDNWKRWHADCTNFFPGFNETLDCFPSCPESATNKCKVLQPDPHIFMDDSGI